MKIDTGVLVNNLHQMPAIAQAADDLDFDGLWTFETANEPFLPLVLAAEHSRRLSIGTSIAVAFVRSPTILAHLGWEGPCPIFQRTVHSRARHAGQGTQRATFQRQVGQTRCPNA